MSGLRLWIMAARPRTLPAAVSPVIVGTAVAVAAVDSLRVGAFIAALLGSIFIPCGDQSYGGEVQFVNASEKNRRFGEAPLVGMG